MCLYVEQFIFSQDFFTPTMEVREKMNFHHFDNFSPMSQSALDLFLSFLRAKSICAALLISFAEYKISTNC